MDLGLTGKRALVLGASRGIGRGIADTLAAEGARVIVASRDGDACDAAAAAMREAHGAEVLGTSCDMSDIDAVDRVASFAEDAFGGIDVLVNNAGRILVGPVGDIEPTDVSAMLETNVLGPILLTTRLLPLLRRSDQGHIVNVGSMLGDIAMPMFAAYAASKFGLRGWSDGLRRELRHEGIKVTYAAPRATQTSAASAFEHLIEPFGMKVDVPEAVALRIWRDVQKGRATSYPFGVERFARSLQAFVPGVIDRVLSGQFKKTGPATL